jgi:hypothetical protein
MKTSWTQQTILDLIQNQIEESLNLEYKAADALDKSSDSKKKEIAKDVSAMANSDGGTIIYGIKEYDVSEKRHLPERIDSVNRVKVSKEWLEQVLNTNIFPRIPNITIEPITISKSPTDVIYVVTIPKSNTAHQANDKRYYRRFNFESVAMYDYEIRDIFNRAQSPIINLEFLIEKETYQIHDIIPGIPSFTYQKREPEYETNVELLVFAYNDGKILAKYINCFLEIPEIVLLKNKRLLENKRTAPEVFLREGIPFVKRHRENTDRDVVGTSGQSPYTYPNYGPTRYIPVLPKTKISLSTNSYSRILLEKDLDFNDLKIYWTVYADNAEPIAGESLLKEIKVKDKSTE